MSYIDSIRARLADPEGPYVVLRVDVAEALCDLADAAYGYEHAPTYTANCDCADCTAYRGKAIGARARLRRELDRVYGGDEAKLARIRAMRPDDETDAT